jgi:hypothetical protein
MRIGDRTLGEPANRAATWRHLSGAAERCVERRDLTVGAKPMYIWYRSSTSTVFLRRSSCRSHAEYLGEENGDDA